MLEDAADLADLRSESPINKLGSNAATPFCSRKRQTFAVLAHLGLANVYAMRMNLSEAAEPMQKEFRWSDPQQGYVLSSFFWGYVLFQIPGAILARRYGGKRIFGIGVLGTSLLTIALPLYAQYLWLLYACRALMGLLEAVTYPALNEMFTHWVPVPERALIVTFVTAGAYVGNALAMPVAGILIGIGKNSACISNTWPSVFYSFGVVGCIWFFFWELLITSTPAQHKTMTTQEREYLEATTHRDADVIGELVNVQKSVKVPWMNFLTNSAAWTLYVNHFALNYGVYTMMTYMPKFLDEVLDMNMKNAGLVSFLPYLLMAVASILGGFVADYMRLRCRIRIVRVVFLVASFLSSGVFLVLLGWTTEDKTLAVSVMTLAIGCSGLANASYGPNFMDISPFYAGQLFGLSNVIANIAGIVAPLVAGELLGSDVGSAALEDWQHVFYIPAIVYTLAAMLWVLFMQAKPIQALN